MSWERAEAPAGWRATAALYRALAFASAALGCAVILGRADLAVLAAPLAIGLVLAGTVGRPIGALPVARASVGGEVIADRAVEVTVEVTLELPITVGVQLVSVAMPDAKGEPGGTAVTMPGGGAAVAAVRSKAVSWGPMVLARPDLVAAGADGLWRAGPVVGQPLVVTVLPAVEPLGRLTLAPLFGGWAGEHRSRRPGQGGDLIDLREFAPGDRLRSIHWRAYARHQRLYVRRTQSDADTDVVLCADTRHEVIPQTRPLLGGRVGGFAAARLRFERLDRFIRGLVMIEEPADGGPPPELRSSLDLLVVAAASVGAAQLRAGDRVGLLDLGIALRHIRMGTGSRHLLRLRHQLATAQPTRARRITRPAFWGLPPAAVVVFLSAFIDEESVDAAAEVAARGHQVVAVDVLPETGLTAAAARDPLPQAPLELRLLLAERRLRLDRLAAAGVPVLSWDRGDVQADLLARMQARRRHR